MSRERVIFAFSRGNGSRTGGGGWVEGEEGGRRRGGNSGTTSDTLPEARQGREGKGEAALSVESRPR